MYSWKNVVGVVILFYLGSTNQVEYPYESSFFNSCLDINLELTSNEDNMDIGVLMRCKETKIVPKPLQIVIVSYSFEGQVKYPEQNLQIPNE